MTHKKNIHSKKSFAFTAIAGSVLLAMYAGQVQAAPKNCAAGVNCVLADNDAATINSGISVLDVDGWSGTPDPSNISVTNNGLAKRITPGNGDDFVINNYGTISNTAGVGVYAYGTTNLSITNSGSSSSIAGTNADAIFIADDGTPFSVTSIVNDGSITGGYTGINLSGNDSGSATTNSTVTTLQNNSNAVIQGTDNSAIYVGRTDITTFQNYGNISSTNSSVGFPVVRITDGSTIGTLTNYGQISNTVNGSGSAIKLESGASINNLTNNGDIFNNDSLYSTILVPNGSITGYLINSGLIDNQNNGRALFLGAFSGNGTTIIENGQNGTISTAGITAVEFAAANIDKFINSGVIVGNLVSATGALNQVKIGGNNTAVFNGQFQVNDADVVFDNGASYTPFANQQIQAANVILNGGTLVLNPNAASAVGGTISSNTNTNPQFFSDFTGSGGDIDVVIVNNTTYGKLDVDGNVDLNNTTMSIDIQQNGQLTNGNLFPDVIKVTSGNSINYGTFNISDTSALFDFDTVRFSNKLNLSLTADGQGESSQTQPNNGGGSNTGNLVSAVTSTGATSAQGIAPIVQGLANNFANNGTTGNTQLDQAVGLSGLGQYSTQQQLANAVASLAPASTGAGQQATFGASQVMNVIAERSDFTRGLSASGMNGGDNFSNKQFWIQPFGNWTEQDDQDGVAGYKVDSKGLVIGVDGDISSSVKLGTAFSVSNSNVDSKQSIGGYDTDVSSYQLSLYGTKSFSDTLVMNGSVSLGTSDYDTKRTLFDNSQAKSSYGSTHSHVNAELEKHYPITEKLDLTASLNLDYHNVNVDSYKESGAGALNLNVDNQSYDSLVTSVGGKLTYVPSDKWITFGEMTVGHDFLTDKNTVTSSLTGTGASFSTEGIKPDERVYSAGIGAKYTTDSGAEFSTKYDVNTRENYVDQTVSANLRILF
ncbi:autotransporter outer membrane beta-barrel domain-containing protein [Thiomicrorhabdus sp. Milos-T2]|uniref:autotransporter family protein n=1 Tax=Thiomicrorhabdus sp. Milos-T2 TaxID=90814 RepID=UPI000494384B|nr:autotransporter outer membrane beta-barrel domain-containing protein [Thiomicrorhabdus sp. Milos-T2]